MICSFRPHESGRWRCESCGYITVATHDRPPVRRCRGDGLLYRQRAKPGRSCWLREEDLASGCRRLASLLPWPVRGVAGVPRSGLIAASHLATMLSVPLYEITAAAGLRLCGHGRRLAGQPSHRGPMVIVDDSVNTGTAIAEVRRAAPAGSIFAAVFVNPVSRRTVDYYAQLHDMPHFFAWHFPGSSLVCAGAWDMDGVICEDCPPGVDDDGPRYARFLAEAKPLLVPRPHRIPLIVTARLAKYRPQTETWLRRYGVKCDRLVMGHWDTLADRRRHYCAAQHKGEAFRLSSLAYFLESCPTQARQIAAHSGKLTICPTTGEVF